MALLLLAALLASTVVACSDSEEDAAQRGADPSEVTPGLTPSDGAGDERAGALPGSFGSTECDSCLENRCGDEVAACNALSVCESALSCVTGCTGTRDAINCFGGCLMAGDNPPMEFFSFLQCFSTRCEVECGSRVTPG